MGNQSSWPPHHSSAAQLEVGLEDPLQEAGVSSLAAMELHGELQEQLGESLELEATMMFNFPTVGALARHIVSSLVSARQEPCVVASASGRPEEPVKQAHESHEAFHAASFDGFASTLLSASSPDREPMAEVMIQDTVFGLSGINIDRDADILATLMKPV